MTDAAILATFADARAIKSRSVFQLVLELPIEEADKALKALGGWPLPSESRWVGVALAPKERKAAEAKEKKERTPFGELSLSAQAAIMCNDLEFQLFISSLYPEEKDIAAVVRNFCRILSRAELNTDEKAANRWKALVGQFKQFQTDRRYESSRTR